MSFRRLRTLLLREARATLRDPFTLTILVLVPVFALLLFGYVLSTEVENLRLGVIDASRSPASRRLVAELAMNGAFEPVAVATHRELDRRLVGGDLDVAIVIPPGFAADLRRASAGSGEPPEVAVIYDAGEALMAANAEGFLRGTIAATIRDLTERERNRGGRGVVALGESGAKAVGDAGEAPSSGESMPEPVVVRAAEVPGFEVVTRVLYNPRLDGTPYMVAGTFGFVLSFLTTLITAVSIVNERLGGTFDQLQVTPASSLEIFLGKVLPLGAVFTADVALMVLVAGLFLGVWPSGSIIFFLMVSAFYVLVSLALGLLVSATSASAQEAVQKTVLLSIPLINMSGFAFPIRNMPMPVQWVAQIFPATHYIRVSRAIYLRGEGPLALLPELGLLLLFGAFIVWRALRAIETRS